MAETVFGLPEMNILALINKKKEDQPKIEPGAILNLLGKSLMEASPGIYPQAQYQQEQFPQAQYQQEQFPQAQYQQPAYPQQANPQAQYQQQAYPQAQYAQPAYQPGTYINGKPVSQAEYDAYTRGM